jgi:dihydrofolate synthase/folylpolyglutamate synthase
MLNSDQWIDSHFQGEYFKPNREALAKAVAPLKEKIQKQSKIITIGGTNGKGQTCRFLAQLFGNEHSFCLWTSPHLESVTERFSSNSGVIEDEKLVELLEKNKNYLGELSYFEYLFVCFLEFCLIEKPKFIILEVGMGGRLDASNYMDADIAAVVSISRDHQEFLGHTLSKILHEKLPIARKRLITCFESGYLNQLTEKYAENNKIHWTPMEINDSAFVIRNKKLAEKIYFELTSQAKEIEIENFRLKSLNYLSHEVFYQGTHNVDGMRKLVQFLFQHTYTNREEKNFDQVIVSFSQRERKDIEVMIKILQSCPRLMEKLVIYAGNFHKAESKQVLSSLAESFELELVDNLDEHLQQTSHQKIFLTGSNYFVGDFTRSCQ